DLAIYVGQGGAGGKVERPNHRRGNSEKPKENSQYPTHARSPIFNREALSDSPLLGRENKKKPAVAGSRMPGTARPSGDRDLPPDSRNVRLRGKGGNRRIGDRLRNRRWCRAVAALRNLGSRGFPISDIRRFGVQLLHIGRVILVHPQDGVFGKVLLVLPHDPGARILLLDLA